MAIRVKFFWDLWRFGWEFYPRAGQLTWMWAFDLGPLAVSIEGPKPN